MAGERLPAKFYYVASFGFGGQESAPKPPQAICKPLATPILRYKRPITSASSGRNSLQPCLTRRFQLLLNSTIDRKVHCAAYPEGRLR